MITIQHLSMVWTKRSRGAAANRPPLPMALPLPRAQAHADLWLHEVWYSEAQKFSPMEEAVAVERRDWADRTWNRKVWLWGHPIKWRIRNDVLSVSVHRPGGVLL